MLSDQEKIDISEKYKTGNYTCASLGREYGVSKTAINRLLRRRNIPICNDTSKTLRKYTLNEHYFDIIDTEEKAYFLGLMFADGYNDEIRGTFCISLLKNDEEILYKFASELDSNRPFQFSTTVKGNNVTRIDINSKTISKRLSELGCHQKKSLTLKFPKIEDVPDNLLKHFIRGYFDGDGSFYTINTVKKTSTKSPCWSPCVNITSTNDFIIKVKEIVDNNLDINSHIHLTVKKESVQTRYFNIYGRTQVYKFMEWLYRDATIYLQRKYYKYLESKKFWSDNLIEAIK